MGGVFIQQIAVLIQVSQPVLVTASTGTRSVYSNLRNGTANISSNATSAARTAGSWRSSQGGLLGRSSPKMAGPSSVAEQEVPAQSTFEALPLTEIQNEAITEMSRKYTRTKSILESQSLEVAEAQAKMAQQVENWNYPNSDLQSSLEDAVVTVTKLLDVSRKYVANIEKVLAAMTQMGAGLDQARIDQLKKFVDLTETTVLKSGVTLANIVRISTEIEGDHLLYKEAKALQKVETEAAMERDFNRLLHATKEVGIQATNILTQAIKEWSTILTAHCPPLKLPAALERLTEITKSTMVDMKNLGPEDIDTAMSDAHHCIEDIKSLLYACNVPASVVRQSVPPVQLAIFSWTNKAKSVTYDSFHTMVKRSVG